MLNILKHSIKEHVKKGGQVAIIISQDDGAINKNLRFFNDITELSDSEAKNIVAIIDKSNYKSILDILNNLN